MRNRRLLYILAVIVILSLPFILPAYGVKLGTEFFIMSIFALSLGLIMGYAGMTSFGHAAFFGTGVYTVAILGQYTSNTYVLIVAAIMAGGFLAFLSGVFFIRMPSAYFFMLTLSFNQLLYVFFYKMKKIAGGADGLTINAMPNFGFGEISSANGIYFITAVSFILCFILLYLIIQSPTGKIVIGSKENELRMKALGYNTGKYKLLFYCISGAVAGFAGALYGFFNLYASPEIISFGLSGQALIMVIIGGSGTLIGPPIGAAIFVILQSYISSYTEYWPSIMGAMFVILVLIGRGGIAHLLLGIWKKVPPGKKAEKAEQKMPGVAVTQVAEVESMGGPQS